MDKFLSCDFLHIYVDEIKREMKLQKSRTRQIIYLVDMYNNIFWFMFASRYLKRRDS